MEKQVVREYQTKEPYLIKYLNKVRELFERFKTFEIMHVPEEQNFGADMLSKLTSSMKAQEMLATLSIEAGEENAFYISLTGFRMVYITHYKYPGDLP